MKKQSLFVAVAAIMMAACSETDNLSVQNVAQQQSETAVGFDTYMGRSTRAGAVGEITTKEELQIDNFGVFAYYTNGDVYPLNYNNDLLVTSTKFKPDFMWNQKVEFDGDNWFYFPVKYWPNETATGSSSYVDAADPTNNHATNGGAAAPDKITFFAYAPYVEANTFGAVTPNADGITAIFNPSTADPTPALNTVKSDPFIAYTTPKDPLNTVDLLWGVVPAYKTKYSTVVPGEAEQEVTAGKPNYNLVKQTTDERIMFQFKHALAKLTLDVVGFFDDIPGEGANKSPEAVSENNVAKDTKIVIEYVKLSTLKYPSSSVLNLNNYKEANKPNWVQSQTNAGGSISFDIYGSQLANLIRYRTPSAPDKAYVEQPRGVTKDAVALLANDASQEAFFGIIPQVVTSPAAYATAKWKVEVKYHVFTKDANLENGYSEVTNVIKKDDIDMTFEPGKHYTLRLRLGLTTVKFDATVEDWVDGTTTPADLPINVAVKSVEDVTLSTTAGSSYGTGSNAVVYSSTYASLTDKTTDFSVPNCKSTINLESLKATLENGTSSDVSTEAAILKSDVDWIHYDGANFVVEENRTATNREAKVWATYGGVDSEPITVTQLGSKLKLELKLKDGSTVGDAMTQDWESLTPYEYIMTVRYFNYNSASDTEGSDYIDVSADAFANAPFNGIESWLSADRANKKINVIQKNESETTSRTATIKFSYDGKISDPVTITQTYNGYVAP